MSLLRLSEMWIYPIKSLGGIQLNQAKVWEKGLEHDRRWMLVDEDGVFMTQRTRPQMALFKLKMEKGEFKITIKDDSIQLPFHTSGDFSLARIWDDTVSVIEVSTELSQWFSDHLTLKCRLVAFPEDKNRPVDEKYRLNNENVSLADGYPFLIIGQESLNFLNSKLDEPLPMNRFRPNFVFTGGEPNEEDTWKDFTIGGNRFVGVKPCIRCALPTVNQDTAERGDEPLRTLATYRKQNNKINFGQNLLAVDHQEVNVGDVITIQTRLS